VRVNNIRSTLDEQLRTTFADYREVHSLVELAPPEEGQPKQKLLYRDPHIPDLVAVPYGADFTSSPAYKNGEIILQDKASCFPAYLLLGDRGADDPWSGDLVDGCAAPGNKTTHMASLVAKQKQKGRKQIFSMDASRVRSKTLHKMVSLAGADSMVTILQGQDFLALDPQEERFQDVSGLLLDPSCSGSGIIGRDDVPDFTLPKAKVTPGKSQGKKRKRQTDDEEDAGEKSKVTVETPAVSPSDENDTPDGVMDHDRLTKLSNLQARIVEHALSFPAATHVTYSTCSIHLMENEAVVARVLASEVAQRRRWRLLRRDEQPAGLRKWEHRGVRRDRENGESGESPAEVDLPEEALEACLRCWAGDAEGLGGFFVAGFVRDGEDDEEEKSAETSSRVKGKGKDVAHAAIAHKNNQEEVEDEGDDQDDDDWEGFSD
jgi:putative methyltransferase